MTRQHASHTARILPDDPVLTGAKPVLELLSSEPARVDTVYIRKGRRTPQTDKIMDICRAGNVRFTLAEASVFERISPGRSQSVAARLFESGFTQLDDLLANAPQAPLPLVVCLDQVQDAGNAGALARTLYAMGGGGLVVPRHNGVYLGSGARRSARGALERLPVARVANLARALDEAEQAAFTIYGAAVREEGQNPVFEQKLVFPALLVLGGEERGLRRQIAGRCHHFLHIPMLREFDSLGVAQAGAILISCFARQKLQGI